METISVALARRLALARAGLLNPRWTDMPSTARGAGASARRKVHAVIERFGYLQLDTVAVAGARSHVIVLLSRLPGLCRGLGEKLLVPNAPLFEYWGHEASWLPIDLYPLFDYRRRAFRKHPWWGDIISANKGIADKLLRRISEEGPLRSVDMEGPGSSGWWDFKLAKRVATALWSSGELAISERKNFIRSYDLAERVIPRALRDNPRSQSESLRLLLIRALEGHGWATKGTLAATWRLRNLRNELAAAIDELKSAGEIEPCALENPSGKPTPGWIRPCDLELADRLRRVRPPPSSAVLLSPFDPVLWDRARVRRLFGFDQVLEIFKPAPTRQYGYYCLPVLAGEHLIGRTDLKADRKSGRLRVLSTHFEAAKPSVGHRKAMKSAIERYAKAVELSC